ncbi:Uncharacterised protein [Mycobacterium tuberculosis]|nr:Uncharacterised protein [Mycobacterium tuberculosis]
MCRPYWGWSTLGRLNTLTPACVSSMACISGVRVASMAPKTITDFSATALRVNSSA